MFQRWNLLGSTRTTHCTVKSTTWLEDASEELLWQVRCCSPPQRLRSLPLGIWSSQSKDAASTEAAAPNGTGTGTLNSSAGGFGDNQAAPLTLFQYAPSGTSSVTYVNSLVLPQS